MNGWYPRVIEWLGLYPREDDDIADALYDDARDAEARAYEAAVLLEKEEAAHRKTRLKLAMARRENAGHLRMIAALEAVLPAEKRMTVLLLATATEEALSGVSVPEWDEPDVDYRGAA